MRYYINGSPVSKQRAESRFAYRYLMLYGADLEPGEFDSYCASEEGRDALADVAPDLEVLV